MCERIQLKLFEFKWDRRLEVEVDTTCLAANKVRVQSIVDRLDVISKK